MYTPPVCGDIIFEFAGAYIPPDCNDINFWPDAVSIILNSVFLLLDVPELQTEETEPQNLPTGVSPGGFTALWGLNVKVSATKAVAYKKSADIHNQTIVPYKPPIKKEKSVISSFRSFDIFDRLNNVSYTDFQKKQAASIISSWLGIQYYADDSRRILWDTFPLKDKTDSVSYLIPEANDKTRGMSWDSFYLNDVVQTTPYKSPPPKDAHKHIVWGAYSYYTLCWMGDYNPPKKCSLITFDFTNLKHPPGNPLGEIQVNLGSHSSSPDPRCKWDHWYTGVRDVPGSIVISYDPGTGFPIGVIYAPKEVYYMLNTVLVKEIITNTPIEIMGFTATIDTDSWLWQFNMVIACREYLEILKPKQGIFSTVEINCNGWIFIATIQGWSENRKFGQNTWNVTGYSPSILFADPINPKQNFTNDSLIHGAQIIDDIVDNVPVPTLWPSKLTDWEVDWSMYTTSSNNQTGFQPFTSWGVPIGTCSYSDKTDMEAIKYILEAIGAYIQTKHDCINLTGDGGDNNCKFMIKPRYAWQPWRWPAGSSETSWKVLIEDQTTEIGRQNVQKPYYQAVQVLGAVEPIYTDVVRDGWAGGGLASYAPTLSHPLVTTNETAYEAGRRVIGDVGTWINHTIQIGVLCPPTSPIMGLFLPGDMIKFIERGSLWHGQVTGVTISANVTEGMVKVSQTLDIEEYTE